ncbi:AAA family ATPase [Solibacillus sp. FSL H8-0538]|uniref:AAA family ATPase n=1 Tax=Solibacillus sp. FSL H8-0538 TaxID=2921400 RepID=UPI0030F9209E
MINNLKLTNLKINNIKNVVAGEIDLTVKNNINNVLGIYGQNGSGKTAVVDVLELFKHLVNGDHLPDYSADLITTNAKFGAVEIQFLISDTESNTDYQLTYYFEIEKSKKQKEKNASPFLIAREANSHTRQDKKRAIIRKEQISIKNLTKNTRIKTPIVFDRTAQEDFKFLKISPAPSFKKNIHFITDILFSKKTAEHDSKSFLFLSETIQTLSGLCTDEVNGSNSKSAEPSETDMATLQEIFKTLLYFKQIAGRIIISSNSRNGFLFSNLALPLNFIFEDIENNFSQNIEIALPIKSSKVINQTQYTLALNILDSINIVLPLIIPNLQVKIKVLNEELLENGDTGKRIVLTAKRGDHQIPFYGESDGIKKIVSILAGIIQIYNNSNAIFVVDEIDSGIFEFLLGELMELISENASGQLIFTSHNLRALEVLDYKSIIFTTTNPQKRYLKAKNIKESNNLRSAYIRGVQLDTFAEPLYKSANLSRIKLAFIKSNKLAQLALKNDLTNSKK